MLECTLAIVRAHPDVLTDFPSPSYPRSVEEMGERFVAHLRGTGTATATDVAWACDELLLSTDRLLLSVMQRAVCGCALLEAFAADPAQGRSSPSIMNALQAIWPALERLSPRAICRIRKIVKMLPLKLDLEEGERAEVLIADDVLTGLVGGGQVLDASALEDALDLWGDEAEWLIDALRDCRAVPKARVASYSTAADRAKQRWSD